MNISNKRYWAFANYIGSELIEQELKRNPTLFDDGPIHSVIDNGRVTFVKSKWDGNVRSAADE